MIKTERILNRCITITTKVRNEVGAVDFDAYRLVITTMSAQQIKEILTNDDINFILSTEHQKDSTLYIFKHVIVNDEVESMFFGDS